MRSKPSFTRRASTSISVSAFGASFSMRSLYPRSGWRQAGPSIETAGRLWRPMERRGDPLGWGVIANGKGAFGRLNPISQTPTSDEGARERGVKAIDCQRVVHYPAQA